jgi:hypothetical protein
MFLHVNLRRAKALAVSDNGKESEFYWTWQAYTEDEKFTLLRQGFSTGAPLETGYSFGPGATIELNDPKFTIELPKVSHGETKRVVLDIHCWESDGSTAEVKKLFTNDAVQKLWAIYEAAQYSKKRTMEDFEGWLDKSGLDLLKQAVGAISSAAVGGVALAKEVVPLIKLAIQAIQNNSDDYVGMLRAEILVTGTAIGLKYRWIINNGVEVWIEEEKAPYYVRHRFREASGDNEIETQFIFQPVDAHPGAPID